MVNVYLLMVPAFSMILLSVHSRPFTQWFSFSYLMVLAFSTSTATRSFTFIQSIVYFQIVNGT